MSLPVPAGLSPEEESQYMTLLGQQAAPYKNKSEQAKSKLGEFWATAWKEPLQKSIIDAGNLRPLIEKEVRILKGVALPADQSFFASLLEVHSETAMRPAAQTIEAARNGVRESPCDRPRLEKLLKIEKQSKNFAMIQYLEGRISQLSQGAQQ